VVLAEIGPSNESPQMSGPVPGLRARESFPQVQRPRSRPISANEKTPPRLDGVKFGRKGGTSPTCREIDYATIRRQSGREMYWLASRNVFS
jgi:hypothetical protein